MTSAAPLVFAREFSEHSRRLQRIIDENNRLSQDINHLNQVADMVNQTRHDHNILYTALDRFEHIHDDSLTRNKPRVKFYRKESEIPKPKNFYCPTYPDPSEKKKKTDFLKTPAFRVKTKADIIFWMTIGFVCYTVGIIMGWLS